MLVLSRKINERVLIGHDVVVTVVDVRGDKVRLGFDAPREVTIHREEVYREIHGAGTEAGGRRLEEGHDLAPSRLPPPASSLEPKQEE